MILWLEHVQYLLKVQRIKQNYMVCLNWSSGNAEVQKQKYRNQFTKAVSRKCLLVFINALLSHDYVCWGLVANGWLSPNNLGAGSWYFRLQRALLSWYQGKWPDPCNLMLTRWVGQPCGFYDPDVLKQWYRCECCHSSWIKAESTSGTVGER